MNGEKLSRPYSQYDIDYALNELLDLAGVRVPFTERKASYIIKSNVSVEKVRDLVRQLTDPDRSMTYEEAEQERLQRMSEHDD